MAVNGHSLVKTYIDYAGPLNGFYLVDVDSYTKCPEFFKRRISIATTTIHALYFRFGVLEKIVTDNGAQFTWGEFRNFCRLLSVGHTILPPHHPRLNGQVERFVDIFKRALKKNNGQDTEENIITSNPNTISGKSPTELMFVFFWKIRSVFDRL